MEPEITLDEHLADGPRAGSVVRNVATAARVLFGFVFLLFGVSGLVGALPLPSTAGADGAQALGAVAATWCASPLIQATEVIVGALLLANGFVPLSIFSRRRNAG